MLGAFGATGEPDARPTLEIITRSRVEFESLCLTLGNKVPASGQTALILRDDGGLEVSLLDPACVDEGAELKTRKTAVARLIRANDLPATGDNERH